MKALVVYDSVFGNTEKVAQAIGDALGAPAVRVGDVKPAQLTGLDALRAIAFGAKDYKSLSRRRHFARLLFTVGA